MRKRKLVMKQNLDLRLEFILTENGPPKKK